MATEIDRSLGGFQEVILFGGRFVLFRCHFFNELVNYSVETILASEIDFSYTSVNHETQNISNRLHYFEVRLLEISGKIRENN